MRVAFISFPRNDIAILRQYRYTLKYRPPGSYIHLRKEILIMKDKPIKQPWPRSAKVTVWVLVVLLALSAVYIGALSYKLNSITNSDEYIRDHILIY
mgnify:FL=1